MRTPYNILVKVFGSGILAAITFRCHARLYVPGITEPFSSMP